MPRFGVGVIGCAIEPPLVAEPQEDGLPAGPGAERFGGLDGRHGKVVPRLGRGIERVPVGCGLAVVLNVGGAPTPGDELAAGPYLRRAVLYLRGQGQLRPGLSRFRGRPARGRRPGGRLWDAEEGRQAEDPHAHGERQQGSEPTPGEPSWTSTGRMRNGLAQAHVP
jgi:hypothetical protein